MAENYSYDIFLVSAIEDIEFADMVARRLRALKMKVWFDKKRDSRTFDSKDARNAEKSRNMLVLWSHAADQSDWVHAAARTGRSRDMLIQTALDDVVPRDPFHIDKRIDLSGLSARKTVPGFEGLVGELGKVQGRTGLADYIKMSASEKEAWYKKHKADPMAVAAAARKAASEPHLSEMRKRTDEWAAWTPESAAGLPYGVPDNLSLVGGIADKVKEGLAGFGITSLKELAMLDDARHAELEDALSLSKERILREEWVEQARELLEGLPPRAKVDLALWTRLQEEYAAEAVAAPAALYAEAPVHEDAPAIHAVPESRDHIKIGILTAILSLIALLFFLGWLFGKDEREALSVAGVNACPAGQYPVSLAPLK